MEDSGVVLNVDNLTVSYETEKGPLHTVRNVSLKIKPGQIYGLVGESGSGKTTLARAVVRYLPSNGKITSGSVKLSGIDLYKLPQKEVRGIWGSKVTMVHQDPNATINPSMLIGDQIAEMARTHLKMTKKDARDQALEMLKKVHMPDPGSVAKRYAHQLSGGMLQRVLIATALSTNPEFLIMDEPTTALDVTTEAVILDLIHELMEEYKTSILFITHNLGVVARICDNVGVLYAGEIMEEGSIEDVFNKKLHPYTKGLLGCVPRVNASKKDINLSSIPGYIPRPDDLPPGCIFAPRCELVEDACEKKRPPLKEIASNHFSTCLRVGKMNQIECKEKKIKKHEEKLGEIVLEARNIKKYFPFTTGLRSLFGGKRVELKAVDDISVRMRSSFTLGIVGESGCGKTTLARCIAGLEKATSGDIELQGKLLAYSVSKRPREILQKIQMVFQNPDASLNPQHPAGVSVARPLILLRNMNKREVCEKVKELFAAVSLPEDYIKRLPHELSGGEKQRVAIARAFAADPALMICDEPISSLDVSVQASLMNLLTKLQSAAGTSYLFISHDLAAVRHVSDWIAVVYLGRLLEIGSAEDVFVPPYHPYTEALLSAIPIPDPQVKQNHVRLKGSVPSPLNIPPGCRFHTRCPRKYGEICEKEEPPWQDKVEGHRICCHIPLEELKVLQGKGLFKETGVGGGK
jgi:peptide/nickel transport system ATP-binding protein